MAVRRGVWLVVALIFMAVMISASALIVTGLLIGREPQVAGNSTLMLKLSDGLDEIEPGGVFGQLFEAPPTVRTVIETLRKAKVDRRVTGLILKPGNGGALWGKVQEVRDAVADFRTSGKPAIAFLEYAGDQEFYLASACDKVFLAPTSTLDLTGLASYELFLRGTLDKIGAYPDVVHIGQYKSAANTFTEKGFTAPHREMAESLNNDLYDQLVRGLAQGRHKTPEEMRLLIDHGPYLPEDAIRAGLIDDVAYEDELDDKAALARGGTPKILDVRDYRRVSAGSLGLGRGQRIALIYAVGMITSGESDYATGGQNVGSDTMIAHLRKVRADDSIKAVVLRIDSPGGSAVASDLIWREVQLTRQKKPVIASMSDVAASGGYYIAMPAHAIVAQPSTLTGSIGVVMIKFALGGSLDKLGINIDRVTAGRWADMWAPDRPFTAEERQRVEQAMQATYESFVEKAASGRNTTPEKIDAVAQGRVWTGAQAKQLGLVDELGGLDRAIALAKQRAKIDDKAEVELVIYPPRKSFYELVQSPFGLGEGGLLARLIGLRDVRPVQTLTAPLRLFRRNEPLAIMPNVFVR